MYSTRYYPFLMKLKFLGHIFEKHSNINFHEINPVEAELFHEDGQTDKHEEANSRFSQICETA
jgi:hypothetical protein